MNIHDVRNAGQALAYVTDCQLATLCDLAGKKKPPKAEFARQISIAQRAIDWMVAFKIDFSGTRATKVIEAGTVSKWVEQFRPKC